MFHIIEKHKGPAQVLLGLIALTFIGFTGYETVNNAGSDYIVKVGDQKISDHDLNLAVQNIQADGGGQPRAIVFQSLLQRAYLTQGAKQIGIAVSKEQIKQIIVDNPNFHDANGKFSQALLSQYLNQRNMSEDQFVEEIRDQFLFQNLQNLVQNGTVVSDAQAAQLINIMQAVRTVRSVTFNPEAFAGQIKTDDALLQRYYDANKKDYVIPQAVKIELVALTTQALADKQTVSDAELRQAFDKLPPRREIAHILFPVAQEANAEERAAAKAEAEKVLAMVKAKPSDFPALARQYSKDPASAANGGNLGFMPKDGGLGAEFENAAFSMQKGEISNVVQTAYGYHIINILNIQDKPVFEQEKAGLEKELKLKKAAAEFNAAKEKLGEAAFNNPDSLAEAAKVSGLKIESPDEWLTRNNGAAAGMPPELINAVFSDDVLKKKHNSEPITINDNTVWVVRVKEVREEKTAPFAEVKEDVRAAYLRSETAKLAEKKAQTALADLKAGKQTDLQWSPVTKLTAEQARQSMPPEAYSELAKARPSKDKPAYVLLQGLPAPVIVEVQAVTPPENTAQQIPAAKQLLMQQQMLGTFDSLLRYLDKKIKRKEGAQKINAADAE